ncbi:MAG: hypothetical protein M3367_02200 [Acidobacteriota bacterium]|nr:hypothetical protein [Acidobacteriota bacterium]
MSRFDKIFAAREAEDVQNKDKEESSILKSVGKKKKADRTATPQTVSIAAAPPAKSTDRTSRKRGRPPAKRSDPDFVGLTTYVRRDTHTRAKIALLQEGKGRELSELVEDLLRDWLDKTQ